MLHHYYLLSMRLILSVFALMLSACVVISVDRRAEMPIAAARQQAVGTAVVVHGVVTVASGALMKVSRYRTRAVVFMFHAVRVPDTRPAIAFVSAAA